MATRIESENPESDLLHLIEDVSKDIPPKSLNYVRVCFLLAAILPSNAPKTVVNGENLISRIYHETLKDKEGGLARFWYVLNETQACPADWLKKLRKSVTKAYVVPVLLTPMVHFRSMILKIVANIANDRDVASGIINTAGATFNPRTTLNNLSRPLDNKDYTVPLLEFFEIAEKQLEVEPDNLDNLREWLKKAGCKKVIRDYVDTFDPTKEIRILSTEKQNQLTDMSQRIESGSTEEERRPSKGESEMVPLPGNGTKMD
ncbi:uncharacterized protein LOC135332147 isoform X2 [Halichondria panicea]|uniref:uncharacterized protein LOC135332147 isoform X2 n=1 Tax=Halichondria panicea TaxID=6063 RepID=UPI00312B30BB